MAVHKWKSGELTPHSMQHLQFPAFLLHFNFERTQKIIFSLGKKKIRVLFSKIEIHYLKYFFIIFILFAPPFFANN